MFTAASIIEALGNTTAVAARLSVPPSTVQSWKKANHIPVWRRPAVAALANRQGVKLPDDFTDAEPNRSAKSALGREATGLKREGDGQ